MKKILIWGLRGIKCKKLETFNDQFPRKCPKTKIPGLRFFFKISAVSLFLLYWPLTSCKLSEKTNERSPRYSKTDGPTYWQGRLLKKLFESALLFTKQYLWDKEFAISSRLLLFLNLNNIHYKYIKSNLIYKTYMHKAIYKKCSLWSASKVGFNYRKVKTGQCKGKGCYFKRRVTFDHDFTSINYIQK